MKKVDLNYFPGWVRKSVSFTIDDGNIAMDTRFLDIIKPYGIKGTFNLCSDRMCSQNPDFYRSFYEGYEICNHCKEHPFCISDTAEYNYSDDKFVEETADKTRVYHAEVDGYFMVYDARRNMWLKYATPEKYVQKIKEGQRELSDLFGEGKIRSYAWPYGEQNSVFVKNYLRCESGYYGARKTGCTEDRHGFNMPTDRMEWSYNANHQNLLAVMEEYEKYEYDGNIKFFAFGVHSLDFERAGNWHELERFAKTYGNRSNDYFYASIGEIFDYEDAIKSAEIDGREIINNSSLALFATVDGEKVTVKANSRLKI